LSGFFLPRIELILNPGGFTRTVLIVVLFLIAGFTLPSETIAGGLKDYRLHLYVQAFIFLLTTLPFRSHWDHQLYAGIFAVAVLPTTISSCIVFTQVSGGNLMGTMFNAALANSLGVVLSPLLLSLLMRGAGDPLPAAHILILLISYSGARMLHFSRENTISVLFVAPQKTLAVGVPLITTYFASTPEALGIALLPLVFYHTWQLLVAGLLKNSRIVRTPESA